MKDIDVAIAIVTYKSADFTIECLRSVAAERSDLLGIKIRVIVVDNDSGDVPPVAEAVTTNSWGSWVTLVKAPRNGGFAYANNIAIQHAYSDASPTYIYLLNPDTIVRKGAIAALVNFLEMHREIGIAGSKFEIDQDSVAWPYAYRFPSALSELEAGLQFGLVTRLLESSVLQREMSSLQEAIDWGGGASMMIRREVLDAIGGLDEQYFLYFEETDFCYRAKVAGFPMWYVPESRVWHIGQQSTQAIKDGQVPKRLPGYWYESRRHYFAANYGLGYAIATDLLAGAAHCFGHLKRIFQGRRALGVPYFVSDLLRHSVLWPKNRGPALVRNVPSFAGKGMLPASASAAKGASQFSILSSFESQ